MHGGVTQEKGEEERATAQLAVLLAVENASSILCSVPVLLLLYKLKKKKTFLQFAGQRKSS